MCGICGVVYTDRERSIPEELLRQMTDILRHRGPDSSGFHIAPGIGLGIRRLSIIDLQTGDQPISNEDGTVILICNGEIYNFKELRKELSTAGHRFKTNTDVEVILHLYEEHGVHCLNYLRGMFAFALWDARSRKLMLARDRLGIKPLLYSAQSDSLYFGSEIKSILMSGSIQRQLDMRAMHDLFSVGIVLAPKTLFHEIRRLLPGHYLLYENGKLSVHKYWDVNFGEQGEITPRNADEWAESLKEKFQECVRIHLRSDVPVGAWLSGGIDSSTVVSVMSSMTKDPVQTFTLGFENLDFDEVHRQKNLNDFAGYNISNQQAVSTKNDLNLLPKAIWHCEDPFTKGVGIPHLRLSELSSRSVKVVLSGEGSDEVFGGYPWFRMFKKLSPLTKLPLVVRRSFARIPALRRKWPRVTRLLTAPDSKMNLERYKRFIDHSNWQLDDHIFSDNLRQSIIDGNDTDNDFTPPPDFERWHPFAQLQYMETKIRLSDYITRNLDATSMAYSLEVRVPFLDHEFVEFCAGIPPDLKMRGLQEKHILRRAMRNVLPREIAQRRKRGLAAPHGQWIRDLPEFVSELVSEKELRERGYFNSKVVLDMWEQHRTGKSNYAPQLMGVLGIHLWDRLFVHGCQPQ